MKALSIQVSSPTPTKPEKHPSPLTRFLRNDAGSRSRDKSRASPMFPSLSTKETVAAVMETAQEPSSPKVTCFGQVRGRRAAKSRPKTGRPSWWFKKPDDESRGIFGRWVLFFKHGSGEKVDARREDENRLKKENPRGGGVAVCSSSSSDSEVEEGDGVKKGDVHESTKHVFLPPKNALILTRCRSAPFRSSSLAARIWGSTFESAETEVIGSGTDAKPAEVGFQESQNPSSEHAVESRIGSESETKVEKPKNGSEEGLDAVHRLLLSRSNSLPSRIGKGVVNRDESSWRETRLDDVEPT